MRYNTAQDGSTMKRGCTECTGRGRKRHKTCGRPWKAAGAVGSAPCLVLVPFLKMEPKPKGVQDGSEECRERIGVALGLGCRDKSGIGAVAATFLFRGCQRKKRVSGKK